MKKYDVVGIGNAVVDIISPCDDRFLEKMGIEKGIMQLIEKDRSEFLYNSMGARTNAAGGSVANTMAGISSLGGKLLLLGVYVMMSWEGFMLRQPRHRVQIFSIHQSLMASSRPRGQ